MVQNFTRIVKAVPQLQLKSPWPTLCVCPPGSSIPSADDDSLPLPSDDEGSPRAAAPAAAPRAACTATPADLPPRQSVGSGAGLGEPAPGTAPPASHQRLSSSGMAHQPAAQQLAWSAAPVAQLQPQQPQQQPQSHQPEQVAALQARLEAQEQAGRDLSARLQAAEAGEAAARQAAAAAQAEAAQLAQRLEGLNEAAVEQMLSEVDRLAAAKQAVERQAAQLGQQLAAAEARCSEQEGARAAAAAELAAAREQAAEAQRRVDSLASEAQKHQEQLAALQEQLAAATASSTQAAEVAGQLQRREAEVAAATQQAAALAKQLAAAEAEAASAAASARAALAQRQEAEAEAAAAERQLRAVAGELEECRSHLASGQQVPKGFELRGWACQASQCARRRLCAATFPPRQAPCQPPLPHRRSFESLRGTCAPWPLSGMLHWRSWRGRRRPGRRRGAACGRRSGRRWAGGRVLGCATAGGLGAPVQRSFQLVQCLNLAHTAVPGVPQAYNARRQADLDALQVGA